MSLYPASRLVLQLNTIARSLGSAPAYDIHTAKNDDHWHISVGHGQKTPTASLAIASPIHQHSNSQVATLSRRQTNRVRETRVRSLYSYVKLSVVADLIDEYRESIPRPELSTRVVDIGFTFQPAKRLFSAFWKKLDYTGASFDSASDNAIVHDDGQSALDHETNCPAEIVLALDVLPELYKAPDTFNSNLKNLSKVAAKSSLIVVSVPQMNHLPGHKLGTVGNLSALSNADTRHTRHVRQVQKVYLEAVERHFIVEQVIGIGFLSALPGSLMSRRQYNKNNPVGSVSRYLCDQLFHYGPVKTVDLFLTRRLGKLPIFRGLCSGIMIVASPRHARPERIRC